MLHNSPKYMGAFTIYIYYLWNTTTENTRPEYFIKELNVSYTDLEGLCTDIKSPNSGDNYRELARETNEYKGKTKPWVCL